MIIVYCWPKEDRDELVTRRELVGDNRLAEALAACGEQG
jgi:hypothetical protein